MYRAENPLIIAHRGSAGITPENTLQSFRQAVLDGADMFELDVQLTKDGQVVVIHDLTVNRTTDGVGRVSSLTFAELRKLDAGYHFRHRQKSEFPFRGKGIVVPLLEEVLQEFPLVPLVVEIKYFDARLIDAVVALLQRYGRAENGSVICSSFKHKVVRRIRQNCLNLVTSFSIREVSGVVLQTRLRMLRLRGKADRFAFQVQWKRGPFQIVTPNMVRRVRALGYPVHVWTINDPRVMRRMIAMEVDGIFTDYPAHLRKIIDDQT